MTFTYLDWAATTPLRPEVTEVMKPLMQPGLAGLLAGGANANSLYPAGRDAFKTLEGARKTIAQCLGVRTNEITFTSGATEADNAALFGLVDACMLETEPDECVPRVVISSIEHDAVLEAAKQLNMWGAEVVVVAPDKTGHITPEALEAVCNEHTIVVSVMAINNEIGSVMDIPELAKVAHNYGARFHCDATQALGKIPVSVKEWDVDALSLSAHKIGGPKGVGALYLKSRTPFSPQIVGGGQESARRSGTQNVVGALGFAKAVELAVAEQDQEAQRLRELRDYCYEQLLGLPGVTATVEVEPGSEAFAPHIVNVLVRGYESQTLIIQLGARSIAVSGGSACSSNSLEPSHVLKALAIPKDRAYESLRLSFGWLTQREDIDRLIEALREIIER